MRKVQLLILGAGVVLGTTMFTACGSKTVDAKDAQEVAANAGDATYTLDSTGTTIVWTGKKSLVPSYHTGTITATEGSITVDSGLVVAGNFVLNMQTITCTDLTDSIMNGKLIGHLASADFFAIDSFPTSTFEITTATVLTQADTLNNNYTIAGNLTIKGISKNIEFPANITIENGTVTAVANFSIDRTQWNIKYASGTAFSNLGDKAISDAIEFNVTLKASIPTTDTATTAGHEGHAH